MSYLSTRSRLSRVTARWATVVTIGASALLALGYGGSTASAATSASAAAASSYTIGVIADQTGSGSTVTGPQIAGMQAWVNTVNANGGVKGHKVVLSICDAQSSVTQALQCLNKEKGTGILIAEVLTAEADALNPALAKVGKVAFSLDPTVQPAAGSNMYQFSPSIGTGLGRIFATAKASGIKSVGVITTDDASGQAISGIAAGIAKNLGITISSEQISTSTTDATAPVQQVLGNGVGMIYDGIVGPTAAAVLSAMQTLNTKVPVAVNAADVNSNFLSVANGKRPTVIYGAPDSNLEVPALLTGSIKTSITKFLSQYKKVSKKSLNLNTADLSGAVIAAAAGTLMSKLGAQPSATAVKSALNGKSAPGVIPLAFPGSGLQIVSNLPISMASAGAGATSWGICPKGGALTC